MIKIQNQYLKAEETKHSYLGVRHLQCLLLFLSLGVGYAMRTNLSVAIVVMTERNGTNMNFDHFEWSEKTKSYVLSSFFWGYCMTQIPAGYLADKYGPRLILMIGISISSVFALFTPLITHNGNWQWLCLTRWLQGLTQGMLFPSTHAILSKWVLVEERGALCCFCYAGSIFGSFVMFAISGWIIDSHMGWPGTFYVSGIMGLIWVLSWIKWGANKPEDYKNISSYEKALIDCSLNQNAQKVVLKRETPWREIFTTPAVWVLLMTHCAHNWGFWTLLTQLPTYMKEILGTDIKQNALLASLPYLAMVLLSLVFMYFSQKLASNAHISTAFNRKLMNTIGQWTPAVTLVCLSYTSAESLSIAVILLVAGIGINAASFSGFQVNHIDLSPNFAGVLVGITNCAANVMSVIAPLVVGIVVTDVKNPVQWRLIFFIAAGFYFLGNLLFLLFGKMTVQPWNHKPAEERVHSIEMQNLTTAS